MNNVQSKLDEVYRSLVFAIMMMLKDYIIMNFDFSKYFVVIYWS